MMLYRCGNAVPCGMSLIIPRLTSHGWSINRLQVVEDCITTTRLVSIPICSLHLYFLDRQLSGWAGVKALGKKFIIRLVREAVKLDVGAKDKNIWMLLWPAVMSRGSSSVGCLSTCAQSELTQKTREIGH